MYVIAFLINMCFSYICMFFLKLYPYLQKIQHLIDRLWLNLEVKIEKLKSIMLLFRARIVLILESSSQQDNLLESTLHYVILILPILNLAVFYLV